MGCVQRELALSRQFSRDSTRPGFAPQNENGMCQLSGGDGGTTSSEEQDDKNCQARRSWSIQPILTLWEPWESDTTRSAGGLMSRAPSNGVGSLVKASRQARLASRHQNFPLVPSASSCSRMYWRTCSNSNPTVDTA